MHWQIAQTRVLAEGPATIGWVCGAQRDAWSPSEPPIGCAAAIHIGRTTEGRGL
jgi:hypothetical protein